MAAPTAVPVGAIWLGTYDTPAELGYYQADEITYAQLAAFIRKLTIGDATKDSDDYISSWILGDFSGGGQIEELNEGADVGRFWSAFAETTSPNRVAAAPKVRAVRPNANCSNAYPLDVGNDGIMYFAFNESGTWEVWGFQETSAAFDYNGGAGVALGSIPVGKAVRFDGVIYVPRGTNGYTRITGAAGTPTCTAVAGAADPTTAAPTSAPRPVCFAVFLQRLWAITAEGGIAYHTIAQKDAGANEWAWPFALTTTDFPHIEASTVAKNMIVFPDKAGVESLYVKTDRGLLIYDDKNAVFHETHVEFPPHPDINQSLAIWPPGGDLHAGVGLNDVKYSTAFVVDARFGLARDHGLPAELRGAITDLEPTVDRLYAIVGGVSEATAGFSYSAQISAAGSGDGQFANVRGISVDSGGAVFACDTDNERVQEFTAALVYAAKFGSGGTGNGEFATNNGAYDCAHDSGDALFVVDRGNSRIQKFSAANAYVSQFGSLDDGTAAVGGSITWNLTNTFGSFGSGDDNFNAPGQVAVDSSGTTYTADMSNSRIIVRDSSGVYQDQITGLTGIFGVAVDSSGNIYAAYDTNKLRQYDSALTLQWTETGVGSASTALRHLATDGTHLYAIDAGDDKIRKRLCSNGNGVDSYGSSGSGNGQFADPYGICVAGGSLWITDFGNDRVQQISTTGVYVAQFPIIANSRGIARMSTGHLLVADVIADTVTRYSEAGTLIDSFSFNGALGVTVDSGDTAWVTSSVDATLSEWDLAVVGGTPAAPPANGLFNLPESIAIKLSTGRIYVCDTGNHRVQYFTSAGAYAGKFGSSDYDAVTGAITAGTADGEFTTPVGIAVNQTTGDVYVVDSGNDRIQQFTADGVFIRTWGSTGLTDGKFTTPTAIAVSQGNGNVFVADTTRDDVQEFTPHGAFLRTLGATGTGNGQFQGAAGLTLNAAGSSLYVSDLTIERIQRFITTSTAAVTSLPSLHAWTGVGWHGLWKGTSAAVVPTFLKAAAATGGYRLWWGANDGFAYYLKLRRTFHNPRTGFQAGVDEFQDGYIETGYFDAAMQGFDKIASHLIFLDALATANETIAVDFRVDGGGWESLGTVSTDGKSVLPFEVVDGFSRGRRFNKIGLRFALEGNDALTAVIDAVTMHFIKIPQNTMSFQLSIPLVEFHGRHPSTQYNDLTRLREAGEFLKLVHRIDSLDSEETETSATFRIFIAAISGTQSTGSDLTGRADLNIIAIPDGT